MPEVAAVVFPLMLVWAVLQGLSGTIAVSPFCPCKSLNSLLENPFPLCRRSPRTPAIKPRFVAVQHSLRHCVLVAVNATKARNITAFLPAVRLRLRSWRLKKSPFLSRAQTGECLCCLCCFSEKTMLYKRPTLSGENWGKISAFCEMSQADTSLGCGTVSLESTFVLGDCPTHKFGHLLFALPLHERRKNREGSTKVQALWLPYFR